MTNEFRQFTVRELNADEIGLDCRAAFEKQYSGWYLKRHPSGRYKSEETNKVWNAWWASWEIAIAQKVGRRLLKLYLLLDDIDTLGDIYKPEITPYFTAVQAKLRERSEWLSDDEINDLLSHTELARRAELATVFDDLAKAQRPLDPEFMAAIHNDLESLYEG